MSNGFENATLTIPYNDLKALEQRAEQLAIRVAELTVAIEDAKLGGGESAARQLLAALKHALPIVSFAIATMPPLAFRGWPYEHLRQLVKLFASIPGMPVEYTEVVGDFGIFANECERWEKARAAGVEQELFAETQRRTIVEAPPGAPIGGVSPPTGDDHGSHGGRQGDAA